MTNDEIIHDHLRYEGIDDKTAWQIVRTFHSDVDIYANWPDLAGKIAAAFDSAYQVILGC